MRKTNPRTRSRDLDRLRQKLIQYRASAPQFVHEVIGANPTAQQLPILRDISVPGAQVSVKSGHGTGKTTTLSWVILWGLSCFTDVKIPCTAPSSHQLHDLLWSELAKWKTSMNPLFGREIQIQKGRAFDKKRPQTRYAAAVTARPEKPEALAGFHARHLIYIIDEASGVADNIFETQEGALSTTGARTLMASNPTKTSGYFFDSHHKMRDSWKCHTLSSVDSKIVDRKYIERQVKRYGVDSNVYLVRVLGKFPREDSDQLIPLHMVEGAIGRDIIESLQTRRVAGLDVAQFGDDDSAMIIRSGRTVGLIESWSKRDIMYTTGRARRAFLEGMYDVICVDAIGIGAGVASRLTELDVPVIAVNVAKSAPLKAQFVALRDQLWWSTREWFQTLQVRLPPKSPYKDTLVGELVSPKYTMTSAGKIQVESKSLMKKRGLRSPNLADALCNTFADGLPVAGQQAARGVQLVKGQGWGAF